MRTSKIARALGVGLALLIASCLSGQVLPPLTVRPTLPIPTSIAAPMSTGSRPELSNPCQPPCWREIRLGKTTEQEATEILKQLEASGASEEIDGDPASGYYITPTLGSLSQALISSNQGVVQKISGSLRWNYPIGMLIERYGEPEGIYPVGGASHVIDRDCQKWQPSTKPAMSLSVNILYPERGMWFLVLVPVDGVGLLCPEMEVTAYCFFTPLAMSEALHNNDLANLCTIEGLKGVTEKDILKWHGFGSGY